MTEKEHILLQRFERHVMDQGLSNECLVQLIERAGSFLNLQTITDYARANHLSYNGVKKYRNVVVLFGAKFVIDNDWACPYRAISLAF